jgi:AGZA family xanthine/uracil permease-like MFS transporter
MALFLLLVPLINLVPVVATTGALFFVGLMLFPKLEELKTYSWADILAVATMIVVTVITFGLDKAMFAGFLAFIIVFLVQRKWRNINWYLIGSTVILFLGIYFS